MCSLDQHDREVGVNIDVSGCYCTSVEVRGWFQIHEGLSVDPTAKIATSKDAAKFDVGN